MVFDCVLLMGESLVTYEWFLEMFLIIMMNKKSISVVTSEDKAMCKAIKKVPNACYHMCEWQLQWNSFMNVHIKDFTSTFTRCMFMWGNPKELEQAWHEMVEKLDLDGNHWVIEIYVKHEMGWGIFTWSRYCWIDVNYC